MEHLDTLAQARRRAHIQSFYALCDMITKLRAIKTPTVSKKQLEAMSVYVLDDLDIDESMPCDFSPRYFTPLPPSQHDAMVNESWDNINLWRPACGNRECRPDAGKETVYHTTSFGTYMCKPFYEAAIRCSWFMEVLGSRSWDQGGTIRNTQWTRVPQEQFKMTQYKCLVSEASSEGSPECNERTHRFSIACGITDFAEASPHMQCTIVDTDVEEDEILRSTILAAAQLVKHQVRTSKYDSHQIIPTLLFSFQHSHAARVIQAHYDGERMFIRRSRRLDMDSDEPTNDAALMLRWVNGRAIGETGYPSDGCEEGEKVDGGKPVLPNSEVLQNA